MPPEPDDALLGEFVRDGSARIAILAAPELARAVPPVHRPVAESVARQAGSAWSLELSDDDGFVLSTALRVFKIGRSFRRQCGIVADMLTRTANPELREIFGRLGPQTLPAVMSAFFHYFVAHEFIHIEQGLGSDQYRDSDYYMSVVMEADHVADVAGLTIATNASIPELEPLSERERVLLLVAIHIASMHSFANGERLDSHTFRRLLIWYLHFARFSKAAEAPELDSITFVRPWTVALPRLVGEADTEITSTVLAARAADPHPASSDMVIAYHHEDGLYRIHRAALTDANRVHRLAAAIVDAEFDRVRIEFEELLVNNPALVPTRGRRRPSVEWSAGAVLEGLERLKRETAGGEIGSIQATVEDIADDYARLASAVALSGRTTPQLAALLSVGEQTLEQLAVTLQGAIEGQLSQLVSSARRRMISTVDQIAIAAT